MADISPQPIEKKTRKPRVSKSATLLNVENTNANVFDNVFTHVDPNNPTVSSEKKIRKPRASKSTSPSITVIPAEPCHKPEPKPEHLTVAKPEPKPEPKPEHSTVAKPKRVRKTKAVTSSILPFVLAMDDPTVTFEATSNKKDVEVFGEVNPSMDFVVWNWKIQRVFRQFRPLCDLPRWLFEMRGVKSEIIQKGKRYADKTVFLLNLNSSDINAESP